MESMSEHSQIDPKEETWGDLERNGTYRRLLEYESSSCLFSLASAGQD